MHADRDLLYRVFVNLGRNAFDAGANTVTVRPQNGGAYLLVDVADNGPGVPAARRRRSSSGPSPPAAAPAARASASPSPATWCARTAARSP